MVRQVRRFSLCAVVSVLGLLAALPALAGAAMPSSIPVYPGNPYYPLVKAQAEAQIPFGTAVAGCGLKPRASCHGAELERPAVARREPGLREPERRQPPRRIPCAGLRSLPAPRRGRPQQNEPGRRHVRLRPDAERRPQRRHHHLLRADQRRPARRQAGGYRRLLRRDHRLRPARRRHAPHGLLELRHQRHRHAQREHARDGPDQRRLHRLAARRRRLARLDLL